MTDEIKGQGPREEGPIMRAKRVWWAFLSERCEYDLAGMVRERVATRAARAGYQRIECEYGRTDVRRMGLSVIFKQLTSAPKDTLVMLDIDHDHPPDVIERLATHDVGVVAPLMFRRGEPYEACAFRAGANGDIHHLANFPPGLYEMAQVGTGAIAIQRWVFDELDRQGLGPWYFRYNYRVGEDGTLHMPSEDMHFGEICRKAGIPHYVDLSFESPHVALGFVDKQVHLDYWADHPPAEGPTALRLKSDPQISQMGAEGNGLTSAPDGRMLESASGRVPPSPSPGCGQMTPYRR